MLYVVLFDPTIHIIGNFGPTPFRKEEGVSLLDGRYFGAAGVGLVRSGNFIALSEGSINLTPRGPGPGPSPGI